MLHPHVGTMVETRGEVLRLLDGAAVPICLDTGHLRRRQGDARFPTNLERDQPVGGLVPDTQAVLLARAVGQQWEPAALRDALVAHAAKRSTAVD